MTLIFCRALERIEFFGINLSRVKEETLLAGIGERKLEMGEKGVDQMRRVLSGEIEINWPIYLRELNCMSWNSVLIQLCVIYIYTRKVPI